MGRFVREKQKTRAGGGAKISTFTDYRKTDFDLSLPAMQLETADPGNSVLPNRRLRFLVIVLSVAGNGPFPERLNRKTVRCWQ